MVIFFVTGAGFKPAVSGRMIEAITGERLKARAVQNAAAESGRQGAAYDANELLQKVWSTPVTYSIPTLVAVSGRILPSVGDVFICSR